MIGKYSSVESNTFVYVTIFAVFFFANVLVYFINLTAGYSAFGAEMVTQNQQ